MGAAEHILEVAGELLPDDRLRLVVDADNEDPAAKLDRIERAFRAGELPVEIQGQTSGYWFSPFDAVPVAMPAWLPTGALQPGVGQTLADGVTALVLVPIDLVWFPLSEKGAYTYASSSGLLRGETWLFLPCDAAATPWPTRYEATWLEPIEPDQIERVYGAEVARRARFDARGAQVRLRRR